LVPLVPGVVGVEAAKSHAKPPPAQVAADGRRCHRCLEWSAAESCASAPVAGDEVWQQMVMRVGVRSRWGAAWGAREGADGWRCPGGRRKKVDGRDDKWA
jgi:hypothetical protein